MTLNQKEEKSVYIYSGGRMEQYGQSIDCWFYDKKIINSNIRRHKVKREKKPSDPMVSFRRSKSKARKIINCNAWKWFDDSRKPFLPVFVTLTFAENIQNLTQANRMFSKFIQRLNYEVFHKKGARLVYLGVVEFQKRGAVHYHIIFFNLPFIQNIREIWDEGRVDVKAVWTLREVINYVSKYMVKEASDGRLRGKKRFFTSRKILRPVNIRSYSVARNVKDKLKSRLKYYKEFYVEFVGKIELYHHELNSNETLFDFYIPDFKVNLDRYVKLRIESEINKEQEKTKL